MIDLKLRPNGKRVSPELYGIFLEDINYACDGGLNANMVNNYSFDGVYLDKKKKASVEDSLRYWKIRSGKMESSDIDALSTNSKYAHLTVHPETTLENLGYNGGGANKDKCAMYIAPGKHYHFRCMVRSCGYSGNLRIRVEDGDGIPLTETLSAAIRECGWHSCDLTLNGIQEGYGKLVVSFDESGALDMDCVEFYDNDYWNPGDSKWQHGKLRKDLMEALKELHPAFVRFPGGCIVEGKQRGNEYNWKDTVGPLWQRKSKYCLWAERVEDGGYCQSYQIGFYEYFCMCEDLSAKPLPTLFAGINCQMRSFSRIKTGSKAFRDYVIQNYLDLIEFANGDPAKSRWAKLRADMGHPAPFGLDRIGVGNENMGKDYIRKFEAIRKAVTDQYPDVLCVMCAGVLPFDFAIKPFWKHAAKVSYPFLIDEHSYHTPEWFFEASKKFDDYPRGSAKVYFGEYAANGLMAGKMTDDANSNRYLTSLSEAAFLTGVERNCDVVEMTSYAPLFNLAEAAQWPHNLIAFNPKTLVKTTNYYVQQMFASHVGSRGMDVLGFLPEKMYVSATEDDGAVYIKFINGSEHEETVYAELLCSFSGVKAICLRCEDLSEKNMLTYAGEPTYHIKPEYSKVSEDGIHISWDVAPFSMNVAILKKADTVCPSSSGKSPNIDDSHCRVTKAGDPQLA